MKGIIVARNDRESLMPLTENSSKPMLNFFDRPLISYPIASMKQYGIRDILVICEEENRHLQDYLEQAEGVSVLLLPKQGVTLQEIAENDEDCVLFGDAIITDFDLQKLFQHHKSKQMPVTAVCPEHMRKAHRAATAENGNLSESLTASLTEGIFFLAKQAYHFCIKQQKNLWSSLAEQKIPVCLLYESGCCSNLSTVNEYLKISAQMLDNKQFLSQHRAPNGVILKENTFLEVGSKIKPPVYIGENVTVRKNAEILPYSVICSNSEICESAKIARSVIGAHCRIESHATLTGTVLADHVRITENSGIPVGSVYGRNTEVSISEKETKSMTPEHWNDIQFGPQGILLPQENPNEFLYLLGQTCGSLFGTGIQGIFKDDSAKAQFFSHSLHAGLQAAGISLYEFPDCTLAMCKSACPFYRLKAGFYLYETNQSAAVMILDGDGNAISRDMEKALRETINQPLSGGVSKLRKTAFAKPYQLYYISEITRRLEARTAECVLSCQVASPMLLEYLQKIATAHKVTLLSEPKSGVIRFQCNGSATQFTIFDEVGHPLTPRQIEAVIAALMVWEKESDFVTTLHTPQAVCRYLEQHSVTPKETDTHPHNLDMALSRIPAQYYLCSDPVYLMIKILLYLSEHGLTLTQWSATLPKSFLIEKTVTAGEHLADAVNQLLNLTQDNKEVQEHPYRFRSKKGITTVTRQENSITILSESDREEYAKELTDFYAEQFTEKQ